MRMKSLILIFIALGCGLVASIGISQVMDRGGGGGKIEMEQILVALADIDIGTRLDDKNVQLEDWPKNKVPEGAVRRLEDIKDKFASGRFYKGEPLNVRQITDNPDTVAVNIPPGYRAVPVKVEEDTVMKAISPGDRVDVNVYLRKNQEVPKTGVFTILKNVRIFAVNTNTERTTSDSTSGKPQSASFRTVSLLVKQEQARDLNLAAQVGKILLTLRRPDDKDDQLDEDMTPIDELLGGSNLASDSVVPGANTLGGSILDTIKSSAGQAPVHSSGGTPQNSLIIQTPNGFEQYDWFGPNQLPVKSTPVSLPPQPQPPQPAPASSPAPEPATDGESEPTTPPAGPAANWLD